MPGLKVRELNHCLESGARPFIEHFQSEMRQHPVLSRDGHEVGGNADNQEVKQRQQVLERNTMPLGISLNKLEPHSAA